MKFNIKILVLFAVIEAEGILLEKIRKFHILDESEFQNVPDKISEPKQIHKIIRRSHSEDHHTKYNVDHDEKIYEKDHDFWPKDKYDHILGDDHVQTPIAVWSSNALHINKVKPLKFSGHWARDGQAWIENDGLGHTARVSFEHRQIQPHLSGGLLKGRYIFEQMHFHWGENDNVGSEHNVDGKIFSMEAHLVHYDSKYSNFTEAVKHKDGLIVIAFLFQARRNVYNVGFSKISQQIHNIIAPDSKSSIDSDSLIWMSGLELNSNYFAYKGSFTTGDFNEVVTWIVYKKPVFVSSQQVAVFREIIDTQGEKIMHNYRSIQTSAKPPKVVFVGRKSKY